MSDPDERAFPVSEDRPIKPGLSKMEYFVAIALQELLVKPDHVIAGNLDNYNRLAVQVSDKLIAALNE